MPQSGISSPSINRGRQQLLLRTSVFGYRAPVDPKENRPGMATPFGFMLSRAARAGWGTCRITAWQKSPIREVPGRESGPGSGMVTLS